jgi:YHS domain-containing protein
MPTLVGKSMPIDPVCGMEIGEDSQFKSNSGGKTIYYFCCLHCKARFDKDPAKFNAS